MDRKPTSSVESTNSSGPKSSGLIRVETEIAKTEAAIDRYLSAFENNTMPETTCGPRVEALSRKATELRQRRDELGLLIDDTPTTTRPTVEHLSALRDRIRNDIDAALPDTVQALLQAMTVKIEVTSRADITPTFRIPANGPGMTQARHGANQRRREGSHIAWIGAPGRITRGWDLV